MHRPDSTVSLVALVDVDAAVGQRVQRQHPVRRLDLAVVGRDHADVDQKERVNALGRIALTRFTNFRDANGAIDDVNGDHSAVT